MRARTGIVNSTSSQYLRYFFKKERIKMGPTSFPLWKVTYFSYYNMCVCVCKYWRESRLALPAKLPLLPRAFIGPCCPVSPSSSSFSFSSCVCLWKSPLSLLRFVHVRSSFSSSPSSPRAPRTDGRTSHAYSPSSWISSKSVSQPVVFKCASRNDVA